MSFILCLWAAVTQCLMSKVVYDVSKKFMAGISKSENASSDTALSYAEDIGKIVIVVYIVLSTISFLWHRNLFDEIVRRFLVCQLLLSQIGECCVGRFVNFTEVLIFNSSTRRLYQSNYLIFVRLALFSEFSYFFCRFSIPFPRKLETADSSSHNSFGVLI